MMPSKCDAISWYAFCKAFLLYEDCVTAIFGIWYLEYYPKNISTNSISLECYVEIHTFGDMDWDVLYEILQLRQSQYYFSFLIH